VAAPGMTCRPDIFERAASNFSEVAGEPAAVRDPQPAGPEAEGAPLVRHRHLEVLHPRNPKCQRCT